MTAAKIYKPMPKSARTDWPILLHNRQPGPKDPARPTFQAQSSADACTSMAIAKGVEFLARLRGHKEDIDGLALFHAVGQTSGTGTAPGEVFPVAMDQGVGGWKIKGSIYDSSIETKTPDERFSRAFGCTIHRWPVVVVAQRPKPPGPDGWVDDWLPLAGTGHTLLACKPAWKHLEKNPEYGMWCLDSSSGSYPFVAIPEKMLMHAAFYSFRTLTAE